MKLHIKPEIFTLGSFTRTLPVHLSHHCYHESQWLSHRIPLLGTVTLTSQIWTSLDPRFLAWPERLQMMGSYMPLSLDTLSKLCPRHYGLLVSSVRWSTFLLLTLRHCGEDTSPSMSTRLTSSHHQVQLLSLQKEWCSTVNSWCWIN